MRRAPKRMGLGLCALLLTATALADPGGQDNPSTQDLFDADGYRIARFQAPVPETPPGATRLTTEAAARMLSTGRAVAIDVLPSPERPANLPDDALWLPPPHSNIPGSVWLANVGYGRLSPRLETYFREQLDRLTEENPDRALIFYCKADCWMSWNAAKRAAAYGYRQVRWYPRGTDGWTALGLPLRPSQPVPLAPPPEGNRPLE
ncbi:PQQ-dependent catabolism-associated CXXCW motif protein [Thiorhodococcus drewsii]|nr:PQQ-dependent catabolism-associated CXXCW motif protein [Thiorhodococcus drewsii]